MNWLDRLIDTTLPKKEEEVASTYLSEAREPLIDPALAAILPVDARLELVTRCQSAFEFEPDQWIQGANEPRWCQESFAIEAIDADGKIIGAVGWTSRPQFEHIHTFGTFVAPKWKRRGIAKALWRAMIRICGKPRVQGCAVTDEGFTLLRSLKEEFPGIVSFAGEYDYSLVDLRETNEAA